MVIKYTVSRKDVAQALFYNMQHSARMQRTMLLAALGLSGFVLLNGCLIHGGQLQTSDIVVAVGYGLVLLCVFLILVILFTKTQQRELAVNENGIETKIGSKEGKIGWSAVESIVAADELVIITGKSANVFSIPRRAFSGDRQREEFVKYTQRLLIASKNN